MGDNDGLSLKNINLLIDIGLKIYRLNDDIIGILLPFEFIFNEDFFLNILLLDDNLYPWKELFENNSWKLNESPRAFLNPGFSTKNSKLSERKINYLLKSIDEYKNNTDDLSKMYLYLFNTSYNNNIYIFNIEGIDIKYDSSDKLCCYRYIINQYIPLDEFDTLY